MKGDAETIRNKIYDKVIKSKMKGEKISSISINFDDLYTLQSDPYQRTYYNGSQCMFNGYIVKPSRKITRVNKGWTETRKYMYHYKKSMSCVFGGTKDTWNKFIKKPNRGNAYHYNLSENKVYDFPAPIKTESFFE